MWHGAVVLALVYAGTALPPMWPWPLLVPLLAYGAMVAAWPRWRATCSWARVGRPSRTAMAVAAVGAIVTIAVLVAYQHAVRADLSTIRARLVPDRWPHPVLWAVAFALANAAMEEAVFRGALFDALAMRIQPAGALVVTSALFGAAHVQGYPPGVVGAVLAGAFGAALAALRIWTGGLLLSWAVHVSADAAIAWFVLRGW